ncbi:DoxX family protein [Aerococcus mictus]|uniref:DoxX family protein n=1 Tax=Aerococcus mictus TaxID=2976810 RepID=UPI003A0FF10E
MLGLCAAYLQGGLNKAFDFSSAIAEMNHFGLSPAALFAVATIVMELVASAALPTTSSPKSRSRRKTIS